MVLSFSHSITRDGYPDKMERRTIAAEPCEQLIGSSARQMGLRSDLELNVSIGLKVSAFLLTKANQFRKTSEHSVRSRMAIAPIAYSSAVPMSVSRECHAYGGEARLER